MVGGRWIMRDRSGRDLGAQSVLRDAGQIAAAFRAEMARIDATA